MDEHIIRIGSFDWGHKWNMTIDLKDLTDSAGIRKKRPGYDEKVLSVPMVNAKKLLKLIRQYGTESDYQKCDEYLKSNKKLYRAWEQIRQ